jgi:hypothetical protein
MGKQYKPLKVGHYYKERVLRFSGVPSISGDFNYIKILNRKKICDHGNSYYFYHFKTLTNSHICGESHRCPFKLTYQACCDNSTSCYQMSNGQAHSCLIHVSKLEGMIYVGE